LLEAALILASDAHDDYERAVLKGVVDERWAGFYAAYVLGRVGDFTGPGRLAVLLEEVEPAEDWPTMAADHVLMKLRS
jgi:hypothetical protein